MRCTYCLRRGHSNDRLNTYIQNPQKFAGQKPHNSIVACFWLAGYKLFYSSKGGSQVRNLCLVKAGVGAALCPYMHLCLSYLWGPMLQQHVCARASTQDKVKSKILQPTTSRSQISIPCLQVLQGVWWKEEQQELMETKWLHHSHLFFLLSTNPKTSN